MDMPSDRLPWTQRLARLHPAALLLAGRDELVAAWDRPSLRGMWLWMGLAGALWGLALMGVWTLASLVFRWYSGLPLMQVAALLTAIGLGPFRRCLLALGCAIDGEDGPGRAMMICLLLVGLALCLVCIDPPDPDWPTWMTGTMRWLQWTRPHALYRVLVLMPMWGVWAMMVPLHFCRPGEREPKLLALWHKTQPVLGTAFWMALPLAGTLWELSFLRQWVTLPAAAALLAGGVASVALCRLRGGLTRQNLLAANMAAQLVFLLGYLAAKDLLITWR